MPICQVEKKRRQIGKDTSSQTPPPRSISKLAQPIFCILRAYVKSFTQLRELYYLSACGIIVLESVEKRVHICMLAEKCDLSKPSLADDEQAMAEICE